MASDSGKPGVFPHQLATWWEHGEGAAKIRWGQGGDFDRCVRLAVSEAHMDPERAKGFCAERHHAATGMWPSQHAAMEKKAGRSAVADTKTPAKPYGDVRYADPKNGKYPIDTEAHARAALAYISMPKNASQYPMNGVTLSEVKDRIVAACKKFGIDVSNDSGRAFAPQPEIIRWYALEDMHIMSRGEGEGSGRVVEAFAAVFGQPAEIKDFEGHYLETIDRAAFNKRLADLERSKGGFASVKVLYNHGMTLMGTPSERFSMPVGTPLRDGGIIATERGLLTRTEYNRTALAEEVLELIRSGSVTSQSFTGRIVRSDPQLGRGQQHRPRNGELPHVRRTELGLREYGTVVWPAYEGAEIFGVRMSTPGTWEPDETEEEQALPSDGEAATGEPLTRDDGGDEHSARYHQHQLYAMRSKERREAAGLVW